MLGALLLNLPTEITSSGPARSYGTSWNPRWSEMYGPDAEAAAQEPEAVEAAIEEIAEAEFVPEAIQPVKEYVHRERKRLSERLNDYQPEPDPTLVYVIEAHLYFLDWKRKRNNQAAMAIALID